MEQMQIPDVIIAGLQNEGVDPSSAEAAKAMQFAAIAGTKENVVLDQFGNTVFLAIMGTTKYDKTKIPVAVVNMFSAESPEGTAKNIEKYTKAMRNRKVSISYIDLGMETVAAAATQLKLGHVLRSKKTGALVLLTTYERAT